MRNRQMSKLRISFLSACLLALLIGAAGCGSPKPAEQPAAGQASGQDSGPHRYPFTGRVVSIDKPKLQVTVDGADIPGFMSAMTMGYSVKNAAQLDPLSPEDKIKAEVVVNGEDVSLENIVVVKKADAAKTPPPPDKK